MTTSSVPTLTTSSWCHDWLVTWTVHSTTWILYCLGHRNWLNVSHLCCISLLCTFHLYEIVWGGYGTKQYFYYQCLVPFSQLEWQANCSSHGVAQVEKQSIWGYWGLLMNGCASTNGLAWQQGESTMSIMDAELWTSGSAFACRYQKTVSKFHCPCSCIFFLHTSTSKLVPFLCQTSSYVCTTDIIGDVV